MSLFSRIANVFRSDRLNNEIDEELRSHLDEAIASGRDPKEARRAMGSVLRAREESHAARTTQWLDSLRADLVFGWRQLMKRKVTTTAAVLSLALAIGSCIATFRLIDALFLKPLPVAHPELLYGVLRQGQSFRDGSLANPENSFEYPMFSQMRDSVKDQATVIGISAHPTDVTFGGITDLEKARLVYVSGTMFPTFGLQAALGRLFTESDDVTPGAHPYIVLSYDYWQSRFAGDPSVIGHAMHIGDSAMEMGDNSYQVIGVAPKGFIGTEPGSSADIFLPTVMYPGVKQPDWSWINTLVVLKPGAAAAPVRDRIEAVFQRAQQERAKRYSGRGQQFINRYLSWHTRMQPMSAGLSTLQSYYRTPLIALAVLVLLVLLIACANVANLMSAQSAARSREMALRISLGAGRMRLVRLVLVESAMVGTASALLGWLFALWAAPFIVSRISTPTRTVRLALDADWTVVALGVGLAMAVTLLFGVLPALRASRVQPVTSLKGGEEPVARNRSMYLLIGTQVAFCFVVLFISALFTTTLARIMRRPLGFTPEHVLAIDTIASRDMPASAWDQTAEQLRAVPGVEQVGLSLFPLLSGMSIGDFITVNGVANPELVQSISVAPGWFNAMRIPLLSGRDFTPSDGEPNAAPVALISSAFAKNNFGTVNAVGRTFKAASMKNPTTVIGVVGEVRYQDLREVEEPVFYTTYHLSNDKGGLMTMRNGAFSLRVHGDDPLALTETVRRTILQAQPDFRILSIRTESEMIATQAVRERMLAALGGFFAGVALLLAAMGLYGVLHYSVVQREREIGIRIALGAAAGVIARLVTTRVFITVLVGAGVGLGAGMASVRFIQTMLYGVKATDLSMLTLPTVVLLAAAALASIPAVLRAVRIDPAVMLRAE